MSTTRTFQDMLNEYLPNKLLKEELLKRDYILSNIEKDDKWKGGKIPVPFKAAGASSVKMGGLTGSTDISEDKYVRGSIDDYKEMWGSMIFNHRDLMDHSGKIVEDSFLKILPDTIEDFMEYIKMVASIQMGTGPHFALVTDATDALTGIMVVDHVDRFVLGQKVTLDDNDSSAASYYVIAIDVNTNKVTLSATRGGAAADVSAYSVAQVAKFYTDGADTTAFTSIRSVLLSAANGGSANVHGQSKLAYPFLQAVNVSGSAITAANILDKLFDAYTEVRKKAKGRADRFIMSYKHFGSILKLIENKSNGAANWQISVEGKKASLYGWDEITINSVKGKLTIVGIQEWDDDVIAIMDMKAMVFRSNGFFQKRKSPSGEEYFEIRNTTGYQYIVDVSLFGELEINKPGHCGIIHSISY
ncbi:MAG TPA: hypothetical protein VFF49_04760 [Thermodesulfobacteriota bacterium]|nr:hypothetical protein [Thermodesulfobacteriota bacterium]